VLGVKAKWMSICNTRKKEVTEAQWGGGELSVQTTTSDKGVAEIVCTKF